MSSEPQSTEKLGYDDCTVPETNVSVYEALYRRRMAWEFQEREVPREVLSRMLETAVWAPKPSPHRAVALLHSGARHRHARAGGGHGPRLRPATKRKRPARRGHARLAAEDPGDYLHVLHSRSGRRGHPGGTTRRSAVPRTTSPWPAWPRALQSPGRREGRPAILTWPGRWAPRTIGRWRPCSPSAIRRRTRRPGAPPCPTSSPGWTRKLTQNEFRERQGRGCPSRDQSCSCSLRRPKITTVSPQRMVAPRHM